MPPVTDRTPADPPRETLVQRLGIQGDDLKWYGASVVIATTGAVLQVVWPHGRESGLGVLILVVGLFVGLMRLLLQRIAESTRTVAERVADLAGAIGESPPSLTDDPSLSTLAPRLFQDEVEASQDRRAAITEGTLTVAGRDATVRFLRSLSEEATRSVHAVDLAEVREWIHDPSLNGYLTLQLERSARAEIAVERIRIVREEHMDDPAQREMLKQFIDLHEAADASLLLCPAAQLEQLSTVFGVQGMALMDRGERAACVMGRIGKGGHLEGATVYLRNNAGMRSAVRDHDRLRSHIVSNRLDESLRAQLADDQRAREDSNL
jgi:hypothetical protein